MAISKVKIKRDVDANQMVSSAVGTKLPIKVTFTEGVFVLPVPCRLITSCTGSKIVVDMLDGSEDDGGLGVAIPAPGPFPIVNVEKIIESGTDATDIYVWPHEDYVWPIPAEPEE